MDKSKIPDLSEILVKGWDDLDDSDTYICSCKERKYPCPCSEEARKRVDLAREKYKGRLRKLGISEDLVRRNYAELDEYNQEKNNELHYYDGEGCSSSLTFYLEVYNFLREYGSDANVLEVGPNSRGFGVLDLLNSFGSNVFALDSSEPPLKALEYLKANNITFVNGRWEDISSHFDMKFDIIYTHFMFTYPFYGGIHQPEDWDIPLSPSLGHNRKRDKRNFREFERRIATEMARVLRPNGVYIRSSGNPSNRILTKPVEEYKVHNRDVFEDAGFRYFRIEPDSEFEFRGLDIFQKIA